MTKIPKSSSASSLRLDDILDYLNSPEAKPEVEALRQRLESNGAELDGVCAQPVGAHYPEDLFESKVTEFLYGNFLHQSQIQAAIPQAVVYALAHVRDPDGTVALDGVEKIFGKSGSALFAQVLSKVSPNQDFKTQRRKLKYKWLPNDLRIVVAKSRHDTGIKKRMPVLQDVQRMLGTPNALKGLNSIAVQHLFPSTEWLYESLADCGLSKSDTIVIGKPYSTDHDTFHSLRANDWNVSFMSEVSLPNRRGEIFDDQAARLQEMFKGVDPKTTNKRFLLLDEGGKVLKTLHESFPEYAHLCVGVEHTDRGVQLLEDYELKCPVINIAQCEAKKRYESPMIGESVVASIEGELSALDISIAPKEACVLGYGAVGSNVAASLERRGYKVFVYDTDPEKMKQASLDGFHTGERDDMLSRAHLLIGATGRGSLSFDEFDKLPKRAVMANAASGRHELGLESIEVSQNQKTDDPHEGIERDGSRTTLVRGKRVVIGDIAASDEHFQRVFRDEQGGERIALRNGFVVNMEQDIPPEFIQLTRALILAGTLQAREALNRGAKPGFIDLKKSTQDFIVTRTQKHLSKKGLSLEAPNFRGVLDQANPVNSNE